MAHKLTQTDFYQVLIEHQVVLVDFWATWCGPCRAMIPALEKIEEAFPNVFLAKVDVDDQKDLAVRLKVSGIPTLKLFVDGQEVATAVGAKQYDKLAAWINDYLPKVA